MLKSYAETPWFKRLMHTQTTDKQKNSSSCNNAPLLIQAKFGMDSTHMVYADMPNFIWMCSLCRLLVAKNHNFGKILTFGVLLYRPPFTDESQMWHARADPWSMLKCQISSRPAYFVALWWWKPQILPFYWLRHFVASPTGIVQRKLNTGAQLQTFSYSTVSKPFLYYDSFMAKSYAETPWIKRVMDT